MRWFGTAGGCVLGAIAGLWACTLQLDGSISCGDGYVDVAAGEECDPLVESSYVDGCAETSRPMGIAQCDPVTCEVIADERTCRTCGDGMLDEDEECDGTAFDQGCPGGAGTPRCNDDCTFDASRCESCGNEHVDVELGEECDPSDTDSGDIAIPRPCAGVDSVDPAEALAPLPAPVIGKPYTSGSATTCTAECRYNRLGCGYCGDGVIDTDYPIDLDGQQLAQPEICDGDRFSPEIFDELEPFYAGQCAAQAESTGLDLRPNFSCGSTCTTLVSHVGEGPTCCLRGGSSCPAASAQYQCCYQYAHPEDPEPCESPVLEGGVFGLPVCRPFSLSSGTG